MKDKMLTTHWKRNNPFWKSRTEMPDRSYPFDLTSGSGPGKLASIYWGWKLFRQSREYQAVLTGSEHSAHVFAFLQRFRKRGNRKVHIIMEFPWNPPKEKLKLTLKRLQWRVEMTTIGCVILFGSPEQEVFWSNTLGVSGGGANSNSFPTMRRFTASTSQQPEIIFSLVATRIEITRH